MQDYIAMYNVQCSSNFAFRKEPGFDFCVWQIINFLQKIL